MAEIAGEPISITPIRGLADVEAVRRLVVERARRLDFPPEAAHRLALVVSELATNILRYGGAGVVRLRPITSGDQIGLEIEAADGGPGIPDLDAAERDGYSTGGGLGRGLGLVRRLSDEVEIATDAEGTRVMARKWRP